MRPKVEPLITELRFEEITVRTCRFPDPDDGHAADAMAFMMGGLREAQRRMERELFTYGSTAIEAQWSPVRPEEDDEAHAAAASRVSGDAEPLRPATPLLPEPRQEP